MSFARKIDESYDGEVSMLRHGTAIRIDGKVYDIVGPTESIYPDIEYIEWDGQLWARE